MTEPTDNVRRWLSSWFGDDMNDPDGYLEGCEQAPIWAAESGERGDSFRAFRTDLAAAIRDSSVRALTAGEPQWNHDEWLRNLYYDLFGPEPPPGDPYPVPPDAWGRERTSPYLDMAVGADAERSHPGAPAWLAKRGLTYADREGNHRRPEPADYQERLERLTREGARKAQPGEPWYTAP